MIKCRVHIATVENILDWNVSANIILPCLPPINSTLFLSKEIVTSLERLARQDIEIARLYSPKWIYGGFFSVIDLSYEKLAQLSFSDASFVSNIYFTANSEFIDIILDCEPASTPYTSDYPPQNTADS